MGTSRRHDIETSADRAAWAAAVFTILAWGSAFTGIAVALEAFGPGALAFGRFATASLTLLLLSAVRPVGLPDRSDLPRLVVISMFGITVYHLLLNFGQQVVSPGTAALLIQTAPIFTALLASRFDAEPVSSRRWLGIAIASAGAVLIVFGRGLDLGFSLRALSILGCAVGTSIYFVFGRPLTRRYGARALTTWSIWIGTAPLLVFAPTFWSQAREAAQAPLLALVWVGVVPAALAYLTWNLAVGRLGASRASVLLYVAPLVAMGTQLAWYGTIPNATALAGGALAIAGTAVAARRPALRAR